MSHMLIFGLGYSASHLARRLEARGWDVTATTRDGRGGTIRFGIPAVEIVSLWNPASVSTLHPTAA